MFWRWYVSTCMMAAALAAPGAAQPAKDAPRTDAHGDPLPAGALARLGPARFRALIPGPPIALSADAKLLAFSPDRLDVTIADATTGKALRTFKAGYVNGELLAFSPDSKGLVVCSGAELHWLDAETGKSLRQFKPPAQTRVDAFLLSSDGTVLAAALEVYNHPSGVVLFDAETAKELARVETLQNYRVRASLSADGKVLVTWGSYIPRGKDKIPDAAASIQVWEVATGKEVRRIKLAQGNVAGAAISPDGKWLAAANGGASVALWEVETGKQVRTLAGRRGMGGFVGFSPDGKTLAVANYDGAVQLWETATGKRLGASPAPRARLGAVVFPHGGSALAWGTDGQAIRLWKVPGGKLLTAPEGHAARVAALAFVDRGARLLSCGQDGRVCWWDPATGQETKALTLQEEDPARNGGAARSLMPLSLSADGHAILTGNFYGGAVRLWELPGGQPVCDFESQLADTQAVAIAPDGNLFAVVGRDKIIRLWDTGTGQEVGQAKLADGNVRALTFSADGKLLACAAHYYDRMSGRQTTDVLLLKAATGEVLHSLKRPDAAVAALAFSPDGKTLAMPGNLRGGPGSSGLLGTLHLVDVPSGKEVARMEVGSGPLTLLAFSPDGRTLAGAYSDYPNGSTVVVVDLATRTVRTQFNGLPGFVDQLAFSPDCGTLASARSDTTILLWDVAGRLAREAKPAPLAPKDLDALWERLQSGNGQEAFQAMTQLAAEPDQAAKYLSEHLKPAAPLKVSAEDIERLVRELDDVKYPVREKAHKELAALGTKAAAALHKALQGTPSEETRRRLEALLAKAESRLLTAEQLREARTVEILEWLATPAARKHLEALAAGEASALVTHDARAALKRFKESGR